MTRHILTAAIVGLTFFALGQAATAQVHGYRAGYCDPCRNGGHGRGGRGNNTGTAPTDRPFPVGAATDAFWETQQTNAEAADFIFYDHEFVGETAQLTPAAKQHLEQVALRLEHVPFPITIEQSENNFKPELDRQRRQMVVEQLARIGMQNAEGRVVIAGAFVPGIPGVQGERSYYSTLGGGFGGGAGNRFGGRGGFFR